MKTVYENDKLLVQEDSGSLVVSSKLNPKLRITITNAFSVGKNILAIMCDPYELEIRLMNNFMPEVVIREKKQPKDKAKI